MQIRPSLDPKISNVARDNPLTPYIVANRKSKPDTVVKNAKQTKERVKWSYFSYANYP
jgi:hypothetical protein